jgi:hypothetical protein
MDDHEMVMALFEDLQSRGATTKGGELHPKRFMVKMVSKAYGATENLMKFQQMRYIITNQEYKQWEGAHVDDKTKQNDRRGRLYV